MAKGFFDGLAMPKGFDPGPAKLSAGGKTDERSFPGKEHPDQLPPDTQRGMPDFSPDGDEPHINQWLECGEMNVCMIDGAFIRNNLHIDYVEGGHHLRYAFIPEDQIWVEDVLSRLDQCSTVIHESHEHYLMSKGMSYEDAHGDASKVERAFRDMAIAKGVILPADDDMEKLVSLELNGASCMEMAKGLMEKSDSPVEKWVRSTGRE